MTLDAGKTFLIFSGHNDRAAIALCRYFAANGIRFVVAARADNDAIRNSSYRDRIVFTRTSPKVDVDLFRNIANAVDSVNLVYCPTTEFINLFLLQNRREVEALGYTIPLPPEPLYSELTNKETSAAFFDGVGGLVVPRVMPLTEAQAPCVLKPRENLTGGRILYPLICRNDTSLSDALRQTDQESYFAQEYVDGESLYFCSYIDRLGCAQGFWQRNLGQQPGGKSIVLAREEVLVSDNLRLIQSALLSRLTEAGYEGPVMVEIRRGVDQVYFIEMNPRFWGPLQLAIDACPEIMARFVKGAGANFRPGEMPRVDRPAYYSWTGGMAEWEPLGPADAVEDAYERRHIWDVYSRKDYADVE